MPNPNEQSEHTPGQDANAAQRSITESKNSLLDFEFTPPAPAPLPLPVQQATGTQSVNPESE